jgi:hypothetical protein
LGDVSNTNNTRNRTSRTYIDKKQQTIEQGWKEQSFFEPSRHNELMADTKSSKSWEQTEWQGGEGFRGRSRNISRSKTEREEVIATDVSNTKRNTKRPTYRSNQRRNSRGWEVKNISEWNEMGSNIGNDSCIDGETENVSDTISQRGCSRETRREDAKDVRERSTSEKHRSRNFKCRMGYMADGISEALSGHFSEEPKDIPRVATNQKDRTKKLKALGNSIVPQVVAELFYAIRIAEYGE